jgi:hypothetical protein
MPITKAGPYSRHGHPSVRHHTCRNLTSGEQRASADVTEIKLVAMLLGLYQVILFLPNLKILFFFFSKEAGELILIYSDNNGQ